MDNHEERISLTTFPSMVSIHKQWQADTIYNSEKGHIDLLHEAHSHHNTEVDQATHLQADVIKQHR